MKAWRRSRVIGCLVAAASAAAAATPAGPTYHGEVAPILARHCWGCHREGGLGRIALDSYEQARRYAPEIRLNVGTRNMPPWKAIPGHGRMRNDRALSGAEIETLLRWTDEGTTEGKKRGTGPVWRGWPRWERGAPDMVVRLPRYRVPANGYPECRCFRVRGEAASAKYVRMLDVTPGQRQSVAHVRVFAAPARGPGPEGSYDCFENADGILERTSLGEWSAGLPPAELGGGMARLWPARTDLVVEIRYHRLGHPVEDETEIGLYWHNEPVTQIVRTQAVLNRGFVIPVGVWDFQVEAAWTAPRTIRILTVAPHLNRVGTEMRVAIQRPGEKAEALVWVREWDRHWQMAYELAEPVRATAGTVITAVALFTNTNDNYQLRDEHLLTARWGWGARDERLIAFVEYVEDR